MANDKVIELTDQNFDTTIKEDGPPVLVDFWAPWCGPCRNMGPILDEIAEEYDGRLRIAKVNTDEHQEAANRYGVRGIPAFRLFKAGELVESANGQMYKEDLTAAIDPHLS